MQKLLATRRGILLYLSTVLAAPTISPNDANASLRAILVGVDQYSTADASHPSKSSFSLSNLRYASADALELAEMFRKHGLNENQVNVFADSNATTRPSYQKIRQALDALSMIRNSGISVGDQKVVGAYYDRADKSKNYDELVLKFDYHVNFEDVETQDDDFKMSIKLEFEDKSLLELLINIGFSGGEMSGKLNSKYKFELSSDFNYIISKASQL